MEDKTIKENIINALYNASELANVLEFLLMRVRGNKLTKEDVSQIAVQLGYIPIELMCDAFPISERQKVLLRLITEYKPEPEKNVITKLDTFGKVAEYFRAMYDNMKEGCLYVAFADNEYNALCSTEAVLIRKYTVEPDYKNILEVMPDECRHAFICRCYKGGLPMPAMEDYKIASVVSSFFSRMGPRLDDSVIITDMSAYSMIRKMHRVFLPDKVPLKYPE